MTHGITFGDKVIFEKKVTINGKEEILKKTITSFNLIKKLKKDNWKEVKESKKQKEY